MSISDRFNQFVAYLRPPLNKIEKANRQIAYLIEQLQKRCAMDDRFFVENIFQAGSNAKHTALRSTQEHPFDVDIGVYVRESYQTNEQFETLMRYIREQLIKIYPEKPREDFTIPGSAVHVRFRTSKLHMDIVPIVRDLSLPFANGGWIPRHDGPRPTSITSHVDFVRKRTAASKEVSGPVTFNKVVRLIKWWNLQQGDLKQSSYFCELITAAALEKKGVTNDWQSTLCQVFAFLCEHQFLKPIFFRDYLSSRPIHLPAGHVLVLDAVYPANNITHKWDESMRCGYVKRIQQTYKAMIQACRYERQGKEQAAIETWCQIFGKAFRNCGA